MNGLPVMLHPVRAVLLPHALVQGNLLQRLSVAEHASAAVEVGRHVRFRVLDKQAVVQNIDRAEGIVAPEHIRIQPVGENTRPVRSGLLPEASQPPARAGSEGTDLFRGGDDDGPVPVCLIADHMLRIRPAPPGTHALPVSAGVNPDPRPRLRQVGGPLDRLQRALRASVVLIGGGRNLPADVQGPSVFAVLFPEGIRSSVRQQRRQILRRPPGRAFRFRVFRAFPGMSCFCHVSFLLFRICPAGLSVL